MPDFISSIYTYPWDLADEGLDRSLNRIADLAQCDELMLTPSYHVSTYFLPHNPTRPIYYGEDGAVYFHPDYRRFKNTRIRPHVSNTVDQEGYFERIVEAINKRGLKFGAWIVYCYNHYLAHRVRDARFSVFASEKQTGSANSPNSGRRGCSMTTETSVS